MTPAQHVADGRVAQQVESVDLLRTVEVQRLDALQARLWPAALTGDVEAASTCLRIIMARAKVLGMIETSNGKRTGCQQPQTVILREDDCRTRGFPRAQLIAAPAGCRQRHLPAGGR